MFPSGYYAAGYYPYSGPPTYGPPFYGAPFYGAPPAANPPLPPVLYAPVAPGYAPLYAPPTGGSRSFLAVGTGTLAGPPAPTGHRTTAAAEPPPPRRGVAVPKAGRDGRPGTTTAKKSPSTGAKKVDCTPAKARPMDGVPQSVQAGDDVLCTGVLGLGPLS